MMDKARILVVEDNAIEREGVGVVLKAEGFDTVLVDDGQAALDYVRQHGCPGLILLDMILPKLDGWRFLQKLEELQLETRPHIIVTTGTLVIGQDWARSHGCAGVLRKPIDVDAMLTQIRECLRAAG
jgi:two-component system response regulator MtrA